MKNILILLFACMLLLTLSACSDQAKPVEATNDPTTPVTGENIGVPADSQQETPAEPLGDSTTPVAEENEDDIPVSQQGIPPEYRLRRSVEIGWDDPLPLPEGEEFQEIFDRLGMDGSKPVIPDVSGLFTTEEIEKHFGLKVDRVEEEKRFEGAFKQITYYFEDGKSNFQCVSIKASTLRPDEDPDTYLYLITIAQPLEEKIGVNATITDAMGILITIHTEKDEIITIQGVDMDQQKDLLIDFAKLVYQRLNR